jgi:hypothetical protein
VFVNCCDVQHPGSTKVANDHGSALLINSASAERVVDRRREGAVAVAQQHRYVIRAHILDGQAQVAGPEVAGSN